MQNWGTFKRGFFILYNRSPISKNRFPISNNRFPISNGRRTNILGNLPKTAKSKILKPCKVVGLSINASSFEIFRWALSIWLYKQMKIINFSACERSISTLLHGVWQEQKGWRQQHSWRRRREATRPNWFVVVVGHAVPRPAEHWPAGQAVHGPRCGARRWPQEE